MNRTECRRTRWFGQEYRQLTAMLPAPFIDQVLTDPGRNLFVWCPSCKSVEAHQLRILDDARLST